MRSVNNRPTIGIIFNPKGGSGKTTTATNLSYGLTLKGYSVKLIDNDPQGSARDWHEASGGTKLRVKGCDRSTFVKDIEDEKHDCDIIIVDCGSKLESIKSVDLIILSDFIIIPIQPCSYDIWAMQDFIGIIKGRQKIMKGLPKAAFLMTRVIKKSLLCQETKEALQEIDFPLLTNYTTQHVSYQTTVKKGMTVFDGKCKDSKLQMQSIVDEVIKEFIC